MAPSGAIIGVIGEKGSGVTELLQLAGGAIQPTEGEVKAPPERRYVKLGDTLNLAPAAVIALDQALAAQEPVQNARLALLPDLLAELAVFGHLLRAFGRRSTPVRVEAARLDQRDVDAEVGDL